MRRLILGLRWAPAGILVLAGGISVFAAGAPLPPPLAGPLLATSSFGEYRAGHYHGGLDFSTGGREGLPVLAPGPGRVTRLRASGVGYGKAVYFRLEDGRTLVFAHLSRFHPRIERAVTGEQDRLGRYEVDFVSKPGELAFEAGDTLARTGQSGAGPPHLHAEIRTGDDAAVAVNPWLAGWAPVDSTAPSIPRLRLEPAAPGALVNDGVEAVVVPLQSPSTVSTVRIRGPVRMWVEAWDTGAGGARLAPFRVATRLDGEELATLTLDAVNWNFAREVLWTYRVEAAREKNERWIALDPPPGGRLGIARMKERWWERLEPGLHRLEITAEDASGNLSRGACRIQWETAVEEPMLGRTPPAGHFTSRGGWLEWTLPPGVDASGLRARTPDGDTMRVSSLRLRGPGNDLHQWGRPDPALPGLWTFLAGDSLVGRALWVPGAGGDPSIADFLPWKRRTDSVTAEIGSLRLEIPDDGSYGPLWIAIRNLERIPTAPVDSGLEVLEFPVALEPYAVPLRRDLVASWTASAEEAKGLALMRRGEADWGFLGGRGEAGNASGSLGILETLVLVRDTAPPVIRIHPIEGSRRPGIRASVVDLGTGVLWSELVLRLDGHPAIAEWDPDAGRLIAHLRTPLDPGLHSVSVEASDRAGNRTTRTLTFNTR